uniref:Uncharacterized protein n=1 Tax=Arundo donax TaxID=35708 RepID=A0A0A9BFB9_ARUDO
MLRFNLPRKKTVLQSLQPDYVTNAKGKFSDTSKKR